MCKICVSLFAFLTGWVLFLNSKYMSYKYNFIKAKKFLLDYWVVELVFIIVGILFSLKLPSIHIFLANLFGFETGSQEIMGYDYVNVTHAWYVRFYLLLLFSFPLLLKILNMVAKYPAILSFGGIQLFCGALSMLCRNSDSYVCRKLLAVYFEWLPCVLAGYYYNRYGWFNYLGKLGVPIDVFLLFVFLVLKGKTLLGYNPDWIGAILIVYICLRFLSVKNSKCLVWLGKASMFIWFIHGLFFLPNKPLESLIWIKENSILLLLLGAFWSILFTYVILSVKKKILWLISKCCYE